MKLLKWTQKTNLILKFNCYKWPYTMLFRGVLVLINRAKKKKNEGFFEIKKIIIFCGDLTHKKKNLNSKVF